MSERSLFTLSSLLAPKRASGPRARWLRAAALPALTVLLGGCSSGAPESVGSLRAPLTGGNVVISQVFGGGGNSQAPYNSDFVELFNRSQTNVSIDGWSIQYTSATGSAFFASNKVALTGTLKPGQYYLIGLAGGATGVALPTPNATGSIAMSLSAGKVVLVNNNTGLMCNTAASCSSAELASIVDLVGYGGTTGSTAFFEGSSAAPVLTNTTAALRAGGGCTDTNQNGLDFTATAPAPRNEDTALAPCSTANVPPQVSQITPTNGAVNVAVDSSITVAFSENVTLTEPWFTLHCTTSGDVSATVSGGPQSYTLKPASPLANADTCTLTITAAAVEDSDGAPMAADFVASFTTIAADGLTRIHSIQGASHISPLNGSKVTTRGIVTAVASNGYYLQDPTPDSDDATSEGIFVFTSSAPSVHVGDDVQVSGTVDEFRSGCTPCDATSSAFANLTSTEIETVTTQSVITSGNALPAAIVIGADGRKPPTEVIKDGVNGDVEVTPGTFDPTHNGLDFYESLEDMRVQLNDAVVVGPTDTFSGGSLEIPVLMDNGVGNGLRTARGGILVSATDFNPERITLANDLQPALPNANVGDTLPGAIVGIMSYTFEEPKLFPTQPVPALVASGVTQETTTLPTRGATDLDIAAFNVENLAPSDPDSKYAALAKILVSNMKAPDLVSLEEIQDDDGATDDGVVTATVTLNKLVAAISTAGGPAYQYRSIDPVNDQDGGEPGGNIRVVFLYRTDRGLAFVDKAGATSTTANTVVAGASGPELQYSPGRVDPTNSAWASSRKPLAGQFTFQGKTFFVIANHFNSKGGDDPLFGRFQPPKLITEAQRVNQATVLKGFINQILAQDANAEIVALGDLNDFEFSDPVTVLKGAGLSTLVETLPQNERYTYVFQGNSQVLDQVLVSPGASSHVAGYDVVHVNSEFWAQVSDHDPGVARLTFEANQGTGGTGGTGGNDAGGMSGGGAGGTSGGGAGGTVAQGGVGASAGSSGTSGSTGTGTGTAGQGGASGATGAGGATGLAGSGGVTGNAGSAGQSTGGSSSSAGVGGATSGGSAGTANGGSANSAGTANGGSANGAGAANGGNANSAGSGGTPSEAGDGGELAGEAGSPTTANGGAAGVGGSAGHSNASAGEAGENGTKPSSNNDSGCSCSTVPARHNESPLLLGLGLVVLGVTRRRRQAQ